MDFQKQIDDINAQIAKLEIERGVWIKAAKMAEKTDKTAPSKKPPKRKSERKNATELVRQFFIDNDNEESTKREIADAIEVHQGSVQNVLQNPNNGYEKIKVGDRNVKWRVKDSVFKKLQK